MNRPAALGLWLLVTIIGSASAADVPENQRREIQEALLGLQRGLSSFSFSCEECPAGADDKPDWSRGGNNFDFTWSSDGRYASKIIGVLPEGRRVHIDWAFGDPKQITRITPFPNKLDAVDLIVVSNRVGPLSQYDGIMSSVLWILMPKGRFVADHVADGAGLTRDDEGRITLELAGRRKVRCRLDPAYDWLPTVIEFGPDQSFTVAKFTRDNGRWFPAVIRSVDDRPGGQGRLIATVTRVAVNRPVSEVSLNPPKAPEGAIVEDRVRNTLRTIGGESARDRLVAALKPREIKTHASHPSPTVASRSPDSLDWARGLGAVSMACLIVGGIGLLRLRRRR